MTTPTDTLITALRLQFPDRPIGQRHLKLDEVAGLMAQAADEIEAQAATIERQREALERLASHNPLTSIEFLERHWMEEIIARCELANAALSSPPSGKQT